MSSVYEGAVDLTNPDVEVSTKKDFKDKPALRFRPEEGKSYRVKFCSGQVEMKKRHFNPKDKKYYRCLAHEGYCPICIAASNKVDQKIKFASDTFGANLLVYKTDDKGNFIPGSEPEADVYFWAFGSDKFVQLRQIINEWGPIDNIDLLITCTDPQFQKVTITNCAKCVHADRDGFAKYFPNSNYDAFKASCDQKIKEDAYPLAKFLCKELPIKALVEAFGLPDSYIPDGMRAQMGEGAVTAQDMASSQVTPQAGTAQPVQQQPAQAQSPTFNSPKPPEGNFADISNIQNLL